MDPLDAARSLLPWWVGWGGVIVYLLFAFLFSFVCTSLLTHWALRPLMRKRPEIWVERARLAYPALLLSQWTCPLFFASLLGALAVVVHGPFTQVPEPVLTLLGVVAAYAGTALVAWRVERRVRLPQLSLRCWLRGNAILWLVFRPHFMVVIVCFVLLPRAMTPTVVVILIAIACLLAYLACGGGFDAARLLGLAWPASERLRTLVDAASKRIGIAPPATFELAMNEANAVAFVVRRQLAFTSPALELFSDKEIEAICAHELGHLDEPGLVKVTRILAVSLFLPLAAAKPISDWLGLGTAILCALVSWLGFLAVSRLSRRMEFRADRVALAEESDAGTYAAALERLYAYDLIPAVLRGRSQSHPSLYDRLERLGYTPTYPRPAPPPRRVSTHGMTAVVLLTIALGVSFLFGRMFVYQIHRENENVLLLLFALGDEQPSQLSDLAQCRLRQGRDQDAIIFYQAAGALDESAPYYPAYAAILLTEADRCDEAEVNLREAERRLNDKSLPELYERLIVRQARQAVDNCRE
jgi:Zn-dependent protease with chaperone function